MIASNLLNPTPTLSEVLNRRFKGKTLRLLEVCASRNSGVSCRIPVGQVIQRVDIKGDLVTLVLDGCKHVEFPTTTEITGEGMDPAYTRVYSNGGMTLICLGV